MLNKCWTWRKPPASLLRCHFSSLGSSEVQTLPPVLPCGAETLTPRRFSVGSGLWTRLLPTGSDYVLIFILASLSLGFRLPSPGHAVGWAEAGNQLALHAPALRASLRPKGGKRMWFQSPIIGSAFTWASVWFRGRPPRLYPLVMFLCYVLLWVQNTSQDNLWLKPNKMRQKRDMKNGTFKNSSSYFLHSAFYIC